MNPQEKNKKYQPDSLQRLVPFIVNEKGAKRLDNPLPQAFIEEHDRVDTLSDACQAGNADGDDPAWQTGVSKPAEVPY